MGRYTLVWLAVWGLRPDWLCRKLEIHISQALRWSPCLREGGRALTLHSMPWYLPYNSGEIKEKLSGLPKVSRLISAERDSFSRLGQRLVMASTVLLATAAIGFRVRRRGQPSVSVSTCRVAELGGY
jgi:hypothetical protein